MHVVFYTGTQNRLCLASVWLYNFVYCVMVHMHVHVSVSVHVVDHKFVYQRESQ